MTDEEIREREVAIKDLEENLGLKKNKLSRIGGLVRYLNNPKEKRGSLGKVLTKVAEEQKKIRSLYSNEKKGEKWMSKIYRIIVVNGKLILEKDSLGKLSFRKEEYIYSIHQEKSILVKIPRNESFYNIRGEEDSPEEVRIYFERIEEFDPAFEFALGQNELNKFGKKVLSLSRVNISTSKASRKKEDDVEKVRFPIYHKHDEYPDKKDEKESIEPGREVYIPSSGASVYLNEWAGVCEMMNAVADQDRKRKDK